MVPLRKKGVKVWYSKAQLNPEPLLKLRSWPDFAVALAVNALPTPRFRA